MSARIIRPSVKVDFDGEVSTDSLRMRIQVGSDPTLSISAFSGEDASSAATPVFGAQAAKFMARAQAAAFSERTAPDLSVALKDGLGGSLVFKGYVSGPSYSMDSQSTTFRPAISAVSAAAALANLRLDIYRGSSKKPDEPLGAKGALIERTKGDSNLAARLATLTRDMIKYWQGRRNSADAITTQLANNLHLANERGPLKVWNEVLANSTQYLQLDWLEKIAQNIPSNEALNRDLLGTLRGQSGSFYATVQSLCDDYSLHYVPNSDGSPGRLEPRINKVTGNVISKQLPATAVFMGGELPSPLLPPQQVLIVGKPQNMSLKHVKAAKSEGVMGITGYPADASQLNGNVLVVPLPFHLGLYLSLCRLPLLKNTAPKIPGAVKAFSEIAELTAVALREQDEALVQSYAKSVFVDAALGGYNSSLQVPLDLSWEVGSRYAMSVDGAVLFKGFLAGVEHSFGRSEMSTLLDFTHVEYGSYSLGI